MTLIHRLLSIARWIVRRDRAERELEDELRAFVEMAAQDRIREGMSPAEARRLARLELGGVEQAKELVRSGRHGGLLDEIARDTPIDVRPLAGQVETALVQERMMATLVGGFGALALTLACVGLYGLLAYSVARRTREIGIRMALGAQRLRVIGLILRRAARLVSIGVAAGLPAAWLASRWIKTMLFGLTPTDPFVIGFAVVLLLLAAQLAAYLPARRASLVDPLVALRHE